MQHDSHEIEYLKSQYRCPICGKLVGISQEGKLELYGSQTFLDHVVLCRHRVKPEKMGQRVTHDE